jgi:hypothetical protein
MEETVAMTPGLARKSLLEKGIVSPEIGINALSVYVVWPTSDP